jgi:hypothetical protein
MVRYLLGNNDRYSFSFRRMPVQLGLREKRIIEKNVCPACFEDFRDMI